MCTFLVRVSTLASHELTAMSMNWIQTEPAKEHTQLVNLAKSISNGRFSNGILQILKESVYDPCAL